MASWGSCDFKELEALQKRLQKATKIQDDFFESCTKELAARLLAKVIKRTPVGQYPSGSGKVGGTLRRGWTAADGKSSNGIKIRKIGTKYIIDVINPMEYASYVEYGHRTRNHKGWVQGHFMLTISEKELKQVTPAILEKKLQKFMEDAINGK